MAISRNHLISTLDNLLQPNKFKDYCPNGLQIEGTQKITRIVSGVTACQALIDKAIALRADALLVHHGYFWRAEDPCLVGMKGRRISALVKSNINLLAYHLPLDGHLTLGNNAGLGRAMGLAEFSPINPLEPSLPVFMGEFEQAVPQSILVDRLTNALGRQVVSVLDKSVKRIAWCTGGGQGYIDVAADAGADLFVTGEISEQSVHIARERGIGFIAAGHHATERFGVRSVGDWLADELGITHHFVDIDSPA